MPKNVSQSKDAKKWPMDANFQTLASTGCKVEMATTNAELSYKAHIWYEGTSHRYTSPGTKVKVIICKGQG